MGVDDMTDEEILKEFCNSVRQLGRHSARKESFEDLPLKPTIDYRDHQLMVIERLVEIALAER